MRKVSSTVATSAGNRTTSCAYWIDNEIYSVALPDGSALFNTPDAAQRLINVSDLFHQNIVYTLDGLGNRTQTNITNATRRIQRQHSATFDPLGRILKDIGGVGQTTSFAYDNNGNAIKITDPLLHVTSRQYDALNRLNSSTDPAGSITGISYDTRDRVVSVNDPNGNITSYVYDGFGDLLQQNSPDSGITVFHYDGDGNLTQKADASGNVTNNAYDALDRRLSTSYPSDAAENVSYTYDQTGHGFGIGRLTSVTDAAGSLSRSYDERGNLLAETRVNGTNTLKTGYTYDAASRISSTTYPSGWTVSQTRDIMGRVYQLPVSSPTGTSAGTAIANATYEPFGPLYTLSYGNGANESRRFDLDYRVTSLTDTGAHAIQNLTYSYDADDNVSALADAVTPANSQAFGYDVVGRLTSAISGTGGYGSLQWSYDRNGNLTSRLSGGVTTNYVIAPGSNQLTGTSFPGVTETIGYTATGNINSIVYNGTTAFTVTYNAANRLASVTDSPLAIASAIYDYRGRRFSKTDPGSSPSLYIYDQKGLLLEELNNGVATDYVYLDGRPVATMAPSASKVYYLHADRLGTPQVATDAGQNVAWNTTYQPYGLAAIPIGSITQNLRLPGQYADPETSLNYNLKRDYIPSWGRYLEADPIGIAGGVNTYAYARANPFKYVDREGAEAEIGLRIALFYLAQLYLIENNYHETYPNVSQGNMIPYDQWLSQQPGLATEVNTDSIPDLNNDPLASAYCTATSPYGVPLPSRRTRTKEPELPDAPDVLLPEELPKGPAVPQPSLQPAPPFMQPQWR